MSDLISWQELEQIGKLKKFPVVVPCTEEEREKLSGIYPLMQSSVLAILRCQEIQNVRIYIFGSSLSMKCNIMSDLDLAVETEKWDCNLFHDVQMKIVNLLDVPSDILYLNEISRSEPVYNEIMKGMILRGYSYVPVAAKSKKRL